MISNFLYHIFCDLSLIPMVQYINYCIKLPFYIYAAISSYSILLSARVFISFN